MAIIFEHAVKYHGRYYPPNTPIVENSVENVENPTEKSGETVSTVENSVESVENPKPRKKRGSKE